MQPVMLNHPGRPVKDQSDGDWATSTVGDLLAGLKLNLRLVEDGVWDQYVADMVHDVEAAAYGTFLIGLRESYAIAKIVRGDKSAPK
jgi:hypothetical protein